MTRHVVPGRSFGYSLKRLQQALRARMDAALDPYGISAPQYAVLALLDARPGISNAELARRSFVAAPTMIRMVTALEREGLITREPGPDGGRVLHTRLTSTGAARLRDAAEVVDPVEKVLRDAAGPHADVVLAWLATAAQAMEDGDGED